jgi:hypothetical protein
MRKYALVTKLGLHLFNTVHFSFHSTHTLLINQTTQGSSNDTTTIYICPQISAKLKHSLVSVQSSLHLSWAQTLRVTSPPDLHFHRCLEMAWMFWNQKCHISSEYHLRIVHLPVEHGSIILFVTFTTMCAPSQMTCAHCQHVLRPAAHSRHQSTSAASVPHAHTDTLPLPDSPAQSAQETVVRYETILSVNKWSTAHM